MVVRFWKNRILRKLLFLLILFLSLPLTSQDTTQDYLFLHNNDSISLQKPNYSAADITFHIYSISEKSTIVVDKGAGVKEETLTFKNSEGWQTRNYSCDMVKLIIKEAGNKSSDSDVVIRIKSSEAKVIGKNGEDSAKKNQKCTVCGKTLTW